VTGEEARLVIDDADGERLALGTLTDVGPILEVDAFATGGAVDAFAAGDAVGGLPVFKLRVPDASVVGAVVPLPLINVFMYASSKDEKPVLPPAFAPGSAVGLMSLLTGTADVPPPPVSSRSLEPEPGGRLTRIVLRMLSFTTTLSDISSKRFN